MKHLRPNEEEEFNVSHILGCGTPTGLVGENYLMARPVASLIFETLCDRDEEAAAKVLFWSREHVFPYARKHCMRALAVLAARKSSYFGRVFFPVVRDVDDLLWFLEELVLELGRRPNKMAKEYAAQWIELLLNDEEAWEHRKKRNLHTMSLRDAVILCHPTFHGEDVPRIRLLFGRGDSNVSLSSRSPARTNPTKVEPGDLPLVDGVIAIDRSGSCPAAFLKASLGAAISHVQDIFLYDDVVVPLDLADPGIYRPRGGWKPHLALREAMKLKPKAFLLTSGREIPVEHVFWKLLVRKEGSLFALLLPKGVSQLGVMWGLRNRVITDPVNLKSYLPWLKDPLEIVLEVSECIL